METSSKKSERIDLRITLTDKELFKKAQLLSGDTSLSSFLVRILKQKTQEIVAEKKNIIVSERDRKVFFDAVFGDIEPNNKLKKAAERYKAIMTSSEAIETTKLS
jgi:uncharacterized protein (DUF1778 family)